MTGGLTKRHEVVPLILLINTSSLVHSTQTMTTGHDRQTDEGHD